MALLLRWTLGFDVFGLRLLASPSGVSFFAKRLSRFNTRLFIRSFASSLDSVSMLRTSTPSLAKGGSTCGDRSEREILLLPCPRPPLSSSLVVLPCRPPLS
eukprot:Selendium_serpulae@DN10050_c0_g1_i1.p2